MGKNEQIAATIREIVRGEVLLAGMPEDEDVFDHGVSSLAVIQMQIRIEEVLNVIVPTSDLMGNPTIKAWISLYTLRASESTGVKSAGTPCGMAQ